MPTRELERQSAKSWGREWADPVEVPDGGESLWRHYWRLRRGATISYVEVAEYSRLCGWPLEPWEVDALMAMDAAVEAQIREARNNGN